ncbi:class I SAM-dependent methyltransferase [Mucilaginibacter robiniae]|uniref:Class I SAM-dependent methyltransferase n=1 Tax=Mucilaginibacter robiniae TaxID=2728022 RepID=A0A7L5E5M2_9SPHI|nr:class I SAM-dependent methyltransferase [Mucilaginibacter robiniae]QJD95646.1 class I SAM-dependent methyltransferase [Mucilaginibacter robiniae]
MASNYHNAAWFYDPLSYLVFGKAQVKAQNHYLTHIPANSRLLIVGGGTGQVLEALTQIHPNGLHITYVEIASGMVARAKKRNYGQNQVDFITADISAVNFGNEYFDVVLTAFLFDNFKEPALQTVFRHIHQQLKLTGLWLNTDFQLTGPVWQKWLLKTMYLFFKILCRIDTTNLPDTRTYFMKYHYDKLAQKSFYGRFISAWLYQKQAL